eukprot:TRINITY_DN2044_c2_g2_i1.p1 TRINITY_DN2044_c2_g2~~TRINITY_DN2044_c2_g2_i1.p1  ORF type:complete len:208 (+),score=4.52 TRINITY_DN2044_c2_g2_i1:47-625(+)
MPVLLRGIAAVTAIFTAVIGLQNLKTPFYWHPVCMITGLGGLLSNGVGIAETARTLTGDERRRMLSKHGAVQLTGVMLLLFGFAAVYHSKELSRKEHFTSVHSYCGGTTLCLMLLSLVVGAFGYRSLGLSSCLTESQLQNVKVLHRCVARATLIFGCITAAHGASRLPASWITFSVWSCLMIIAISHIYDVL